jgi:hypothetical protein
MKKMETDKLKEQAEDIEPVEELTQEQKEQQEQFLLAIVRKQYKSALSALKSRMDKGITLEEILQEIEEKRSTLSANQRLFVQSFKSDFIHKLLEK